MSTEQALKTTNIGENTDTTSPVETALQSIVPEAVIENTAIQTTTTEEPSTVADTSVGDTNVTTTETPKTPEDDKAPSPTTTHPKPALFSNIPNFLKKPFEKKHDDTTAPTTSNTAAVTTTADNTEEHNENVTPEHHDKSENRLSRTILDLLHKKPATKSDEGTTKDESTPAAVNETTEDGNATTPAAEPLSPKEPLFDHLRRLFAPKKSTENTTETTDNATPTDNAPVDNTEQPTNAPVESPNINEGTPKTEEPKTSLTRRISTIAQNWTNKLKENNKKQKTPEATTTTATTDEQPPTNAEITEVTEATETAPESHPVNEPTTETKPTTTEPHLTSSAPPVQASA